VKIYVQGEQFLAHRKFSLDPCLAGGREPDPEKARQITFADSPEFLGS
jgi:hypothetical protein